MRLSHVAQLVEHAEGPGPWQTMVQLPPLGLLTAKEASALTGFKVSTLGNFRTNGNGPRFIKVRVPGSTGPVQVRYDPRDILEWMDAYRKRRPAVVKCEKCSGDIIVASTGKIRLVCKDCERRIRSARAVEFNRRNIKSNPDKCPECGRYAVYYWSRTGICGDCIAKRREQCQ